jgi:hypothetical protein
MGLQLGARMINLKLTNNGPETARQRLHKSGFAINAHTALTAVKGAMQETGLSGLTSHG